MALPGDFDGTLDSLAIANPRPMNFDVQIEVSQESMLNHLQMKLSHPANERLPRLLTFNRRECGIDAQLAALLRDRGETHVLRCMEVME